MDGFDQLLWMHIFHVTRVETRATLNYRKLDRESLRVLIGIGTNSLYLYGTMFTFAVDCEMLVLL